MRDLAQSITGSAVWVFVSLVAILSAWETLAPRRQLILSTPKRWGWHLLLFLAASIPLRLAGLGPFALALLRGPDHRGLLSRPEVPAGVNVLAAVLLLDLLRYWIHRLLHRVSWLWRVHLLHHSDRDIDFTDQLRFHPLETAITVAAEMLFVWQLAPPATAIAVAQVMTIASGLVAHANVEMPGWFERRMRWVLVTPGLHRIHHSIEEGEQGRNLSICFSWWDRLFGTFADVSVQGATMRFGLEEVDPAESMRPRHMILAPFRHYPAKR